jgi:hypothetical protein
LFYRCFLPGGFCQPQASLQNTADDIAPKSMRSLPKSMLKLETSYTANQQAFPDHMIPNAGA